MTLCPLELVENLLQGDYSSILWTYQLLTPFHLKESKDRNSLIKYNDKTGNTKITFASVNTVTGISWLYGISGF